MKAGRSQAIKIQKGKAGAVCWGGPVKAEFAFQRVGGKVHLAPDQVWYFGAVGEIYSNWIPLGASPKFTVTDKTTGKEVAQAYFPGSC